MYINTNVRLVDVSALSKNFHTQHGLHLNWSGKEWVANKIAEAVTERQNSRSNAIPMHYYVNTNQTETVN